MNERQSILEVNDIKAFGSKVLEDVLKTFFDTRDRNAKIIENSDLSSSDKVAAMHRNDGTLMVKLLIGGTIFVGICAALKYL